MVNRWNICCELYGASGGRFGKFPADSWGGAAGSGLLGSIPLRCEVEAEKASRFCIRIQGF